MIDVTDKFELAINIMNTSFNEVKWYSAIDVFVKKTRQCFLWDDIDDNWIKIGLDSRLTSMIARHCPFIFMQDPILLEEFSKLYSDGFVFQFFSDTFLAEFSMDISRFNNVFQ